MAILTRELDAPVPRWIRIGKTWRRLFWLTGGLVTAVFLFFTSSYVYFAFSHKLENRVTIESTKIFDRNGALLYEAYGEAKRTIIPLREVPRHAIEATVAIEDRDFFRHHGIDMSGIVRAALVNIESRSIKQGGSTISQQFVRNAVLTPDKTLSRKYQEIILSIMLENEHSKDEILEMYLNEIPYGANSYGIYAASQTYFRKKPQDLTLAEAAYLAALPKAPSHYSPYGPNREELDERSRLVLREMHSQGYISEEEKTQALSEKVAFQSVTATIKAPHFVMYVLDILQKKYGEEAVRSGGLKVTTTLDLKLQEMAEEIVKKQAVINKRAFGGENAALVALDPRNGQILTMVGSRDYFDESIDGEVNVALSPRQPGSSFKPYVYATAFKEGYSPASLIFDLSTNFGRYGSKDYIPKNYDGRTWGPITMRKALQGSLNIPAVKTLMLVGIDDAINTAEDLGLTTLTNRERYGPALVLGGAEVKLLEHAAGFGVFAAGGIRHVPTPILNIRDQKGRTIVNNEHSRGSIALDPQIAYQVADVLSDNEARMFLFSNRNNRLTLPGRKVAAKTGTTQNFRDAWTVGFTPSLVTGVWVGNSDNRQMRYGADGLVVAAPIWNEFMRRALAGTPAEEFARPPGMIELAVDAFTGKLPNEHTPVVRKEWFATSNAPTEKDDMHTAYDIGGENRVFTVLHSEKPDDPAWEAPVRAWALAHGYSYPFVQPSGMRDENIAIDAAARDVVRELPWGIDAMASAANGVERVELYFDTDIVAQTAGDKLYYEFSGGAADGEHLVTVKAWSNGSYNFKVYRVEFLLTPPAIAEAEAPEAGGVSEPAPVPPEVSFANTQSPSPPEDGETAATSTPEIVTQ